MVHTARAIPANANETDPGQSAGKKPVATFRLGSVEASVWSNASEKGEFCTMIFQRRYQDKDQHWQTSHSYGPSDALALAKVADMAVTRIIELQQARK